MLMYILAFLYEILNWSPVFELRLLYMNRYALCLALLLGHCCQGGAQEAGRALPQAQGSGGGGAGSLHWRCQDDRLWRQAKDRPGLPGDCDTQHWYVWP